MAKGKKTGGRKQGTPNKSTAERSRRRGLKQSYSIRTITMAIAIIQRSCSDSLLTASPMDGVLWDGPPPLSGTGRLPVLIPRTRRSGAMRIVMLGIDLGKNLCSLAGLDETGAVVLRR